MNECAPFTPCKRSIPAGCTNRAVRAASDPSGGARSWRHSARLLASLMGAALCAGCVAPPEISVTAANLVEVGEDASEFSIEMSLENTSEVPIKLDMWDYRFTIGSNSYSGRWSAALTIPPTQKVIATIPAVLPNSTGIAAESSWRVGGDVTFLAPSRLAEVLFELGLNRPTASFSGSGTAIGKGGTIPSAE